MEAGEWVEGELESRTEACAPRLLKNTTKRTKGPLATLLLLFGSRYVPLAFRIYSYSNTSIRCYLWHCRGADKTFASGNVQVFEA